jgi:hypothetical protein
MMNLDNIIRNTNEVLKNNVPGMFENTYMTITDFARPSLEYLRYKGRDFAQMRGFWEVHNDYMGGPFVSHIFYSPDGTEMIELLEAEGLRNRFIVICGGPRITHELAKELGYDAGFGPGKFAEDCASFAITEMVKRGLGK